ncbi:alpha/beta fold hydrolase [Paludisphaera borealis]|uniref:2-hydroxy-6-oxononadienedioate/2-hydroxy-6-oxononatrienedioate hydrolase n=1 Tax=Paludisphaera borealis TaxID=1387353 RepID=A0A1U7CN61_9BACT|nr:alpha/beta hydrolase [Paludisphaera borealis]APW60372.1 2-hydroxy-6-oxononadienedioate/2-hydroxy-6-oxononatrienedioate hydrolase [Paludisphaera borealis]
MARYDQAAEVGTWNGPRYRMTYRVLGKGPPLIWVPGIATTHRGYAMALNLLAERFQTIQYSYPGDEPDDGAKLGRISHDHLVDDLFGLIDHLNLGRVFLTGLSFGSTVVLKALAREPRRFPRAVVQGGFAHRNFTIAERSALFFGRRFSGNLGRLPLHEKILSYNCRGDFPSLIADRWDFHLEQHGLTPIHALAHRSTLLTRLDLRPILPTISSDLLLIHGREDRVVPLAHLEVLRAGLPRVEAAVMPTVGHIPHMTHVDPFARLIGDWLLPCAPEGCPHDAAEGAPDCASAGPSCPGAQAKSPCAGSQGGHALQ